ncbi:MAG: response regulator [Bacteroidetes bacterium]|nr:response regulator [Bacteroidota bacterium]
MKQDAYVKNIVLYADDDPDDRDLVQQGFSPYEDNVSLHTFTNGSGVLSFINGIAAGDELPCLIILDHNMPMLSGIQILQQLRAQQRYTAIPVILFTTSISQAEQQQLDHLNARVVIKPINVIQLNHIINEFLSHCRAV